jgi:hypothetical protein
VGFKDFVSAQITLAGVELLHRIRQGQFALRKLGVPFTQHRPIMNSRALLLEMHRALRKDVFR